VKEFWLNTDIEIPTVAEAGGKGHHLFQLQAAGCKVPKFLVLPVNCIEHYFGKDSSESGEELLQKIRTHFNSDALLAVRSSCILEDGADHSFAGLFETHLFVHPKNLFDPIVEIAQSVLAPKVLQYQNQKGIAEEARMAVVIQEMVNADVAGVAFGWHPILQTSQVKVINAVWGIGEGLVSGILNSDQFEIRNGQDVEELIACKTSKMVWDKKTGNGTILVDTAQSEAQIPCLLKEQCLELNRVLDQLENYYGSPQDIEFAWKNGELFLLQSRPISTMGKIEKEPWLIWDNSNIVESYPGLTLPLTFSFITKMYEAVYRQLSLVMGISQNKIDSNSNVYANMLGLMKGRVYYNLNSWFKSLSLLPGYSLNAAFMEKMMGVKEPFPIPIVVERKGVTDYLDIIRALFGILHSLWKANSERQKFQKYFQSVMDEYESTDFSKISSFELKELYLRFEQTLVKEWKAPLVNDFFAMVFFGLLQKQSQKWCPDEGLHNDLLIGSHDIITTQPAERTIAISRFILNNPEGKEAFLTTEPKALWKRLNGGELPVIFGMIEDYINDWGDRSVGELKLETETYRQKPEDYIQVLMNFISQGQIRYHDKNQGQIIRKEAERKMTMALKGRYLNRILFNWILKKARYFVSQRENLRYERTRGFGMVRRLFLALGEKLAGQNLLSNSRDIFYLSQEEIFSGMEGKSIHGNWKSLVQQRKSEFSEFTKFKLPERIETRGPVQKFLESFKSGFTETKQVSDLKGLGCCAGIVRAPIQVLSHPSEVKTLQGKILVTSSTDPGWVTLFPSCSGILVERGSLLSHSAIVSREMGIPCIVGIRDLLQQVETGWLVEMDGEKGTITILDKTTGQ